MDNEEQVHAMLCEQHVQSAVCDSLSGLFTILREKRKGRFIDDVIEDTRKDLLEGLANIKRARDKGLTDEKGNPPPLSPEVLSEMIEWVETEEFPVAFVAGAAIHAERQFDNVRLIRDV